MDAYAAENNDELPGRIFLFRDGVSEGQLGIVYKTELNEIRQAIADFYGKRDLPLPKFTFIVVTKKVNTRYMTYNGRDYGNPLPGMWSTTC